MATGSEVRRILLTDFNAIRIASSLVMHEGSVTGVTIGLGVVTFPELPPLSEVGLVIIVFCHLEGEYVNGMVFGVNTAGAGV